MRTFDFSVRSDRQICVSELNSALDSGDEKRCLDWFNTYHEAIRRELQREPELMEWDYD